MSREASGEDRGAGCHPDDRGGVAQSAEFPGRVIRPQQAGVIIERMPSNAPEWPEFVVLSSCRAKPAVQPDRSIPKLPSLKSRTESIDTLRSRVCGALATADRAEHRPGGNG